MRWNTIFIISFLFLSCRAFKPVTQGTGSTDGATRTHAAVLNSYPEKNGKKMPLASIHNTAGSSGFSINGNAPERYSPMQFKYAILMDVPVEALDNLKLFSFIDDWYGTPYHFGGNSKSGIDCSAFSANLFSTVFGIPIPRVAKDQYGSCTHVRRDELEEGDLVFFHTTRKGISHVGVYLGNNKFVHASLNYGVTISDLNDAYYSRSFRCGGRPAPGTASGS